MAISIHVPSWGTTALRIHDRAHVSISIHVPSWGTTNADHDHGACKPISIHVPSWGTTTRADLYQLRKLFQSTFPRGERLMTRAHSPETEKFQSTFPRGERPIRQPSSYLQEYFNPRSLVGNDEITFDFLYCDTKFQSTFPRGERRHIFTNILCFFMQ